MAREGEEVEQLKVEDGRGQRPKWLEEVERSKVESRRRKKAEEAEESKAHTLCKNRKERGTRHDVAVHIDRSGERASNDPSPRNPIRGAKNALPFGMTTLRRFSIGGEEMAVHPLQDEGAHFGQLGVGAVE